FQNTTDGSGGVIDTSGNGHNGTLSGLTVASNIVPPLSPNTLYGLSISDPANPAGEFTVSLSALHGAVTQSLITGTLTEINSALAAGVTYTPDFTGPSSDTLTMTVTDGEGHGAVTNFVFNVGQAGPVVLTGTAGNDVIIATAYD